MKKIILFFMLMMSSFVFFSCSSDDDIMDLPSSSIEQKLTGKWYFTDPSTKPSSNNSFTFTSNGKITYRYWGGGSENDYDSETGTFTINNDKLTMVFPETVTYTFVQKVVFLSDKKVQFIATGNPSEEPYEGTYYKAE